MRCLCCQKEQEENRNPSGFTILFYLDDMEHYQMKYNETCACCKPINNRTLLCFKSFVPSGMNACRRIGQEL